MRTQYTDFIGTFVQHCHILDHEDQGMMQLIDIVDPTQAPKAPVASLGQPGSIAPDFELPDAQGKIHSLADYRGKPTVLFFFKGHGCLHCAQQVGVFSNHYPSFLTSGVQVIGISSDSESSLREALDATSCPFPLLADPEGIAFAKFGCVAADGLQHGTFVLNSEQRINWQTIGSMPYLSVLDLLPLTAEASTGTGSTVSKSITTAPTRSVR